MSTRCAFFKQFDVGTGDDTQERQQWLGDISLNDLWQEVQQLQWKPS
ncbi:MAG: hypothetical protein AAGI69_17075 [Cyanobacteria bacterium P01_H01_bin.21]